MFKVEVLNFNWKMLNKTADATCVKSFIIHTATAEVMNGFVATLNEIAVIMSCELSDKQLKYKYQTNVKDNIKVCDWVGMPEMSVDERVLNSPEITVHYKLTEGQFKTFQKLILEKTTIKLTLKSKSFWFPKRMTSLKDNDDKYWVDTVKPRYPIYIITKGRWEKRYTSKYLEWAEIDYKIVVEPQEFEKYAEVIDPAKILILPAEYLGLDQGGIPARNFVLAHSRANGDYRHWILDDNIKMYSRHYKNQRRLVCGGSAFRTVEDFVDRYTNVKLAGHQYQMFMPPTCVAIKAYTANTRIFSSILIRNDIEYEWRGKYNEDVDLSLRVLKSGSPTLLFNGFLCDKEESGKQKGGNTDSIYINDGLKRKVLALIEQHPDVTKEIVKYGHPHHLVNYKPFKGNKLIKKEVIEPMEEYNLELKLKSELKPFWRA